MQTIEILQGLVNSITANPFILSKLPWEDIQLCLLTELECRDKLYTPEQIQRRNALFRELIEEMRQYAADGDAVEVLSRFRQAIFVLQALPDPAYTDPLLEQANFDHACLRHHRENTIVVLGDSHVNFFSGNEELTFLPIGQNINICPSSTPYPFTPLHLGPCLAYNSNRYDTTFRFKEKAEYLFQTFIRPHARILCCLGEIDIRVHVFKQAALQQRTYQNIVDDILAQYFAFLLRLRELGYQVSCWGPVASQSEACPVDPNFPRNGTEVERNMATAYFNLELARFCEQNNMPFLSVFPELITPDFLTRNEYYSPDHCHLGQAALPLALPQWQKIL